MPPESCISLTVRLLLVVTLLIRFMKSNNCPAEAARVLTGLMIKLPERLGRTKRSVSKQTRVDLYKYGGGHTFPLVSSLFAFCDTLDLDPGWFVTVARQVQKGILSQDQALDLLSSFDLYREKISLMNQITLQQIQSESPKM